MGTAESEKLFMCRLCCGLDMGGGREAGEREVDLGQHCRVESVRLC